MKLDLSEAEKFRLEGIEKTLSSVRKGLFDNYPGDAGLIKLKECRMLLEEIIQDHSEPKTSAKPDNGSGVLWPRATTNRP